MSETLSRDPETQSSGYALAPSYPATSSSDQSGSHLPPFSTFTVEMDASTGFNFAESRVMEIPHWDYYHETRLMDRIENGIIVSQAQYRPWESKTIDSTQATFADAFAAQNGVSKLPSFQSQFQAFNEPVTTSDQPTLTTLTPVSPSVSSPNLTTLGTVPANFHTLNRNYPLVPAPIQAREIPSIQQQFLDERHIQLYTHPTQFPHQNGTIIQNISAPTVVHVVKTEPDLRLTLHPQENLKLQNITLHPTQFQNPMSTMIDHSGGIYNGLDKKINGIHATSISSPTRSDFRKKERRKIRASSLESSAESDGASSNMEIGNENSGQVAAVSSTAGYKHHSMGMSSMDIDDMNGSMTDKQVKKKRKRCGECIGCQRKDNCGDCAPCRNDKSHQICKQRRCEKLTEKKNLYGDPAMMRGEGRRGRGKGRGGGSYRGRKAAAAAAISNNAASEQPPAPVSRPSPQPAVHMIKQEPVHMIKQEPVHMIKQEPVQQQTMAPVPFYTDPNRFTTPVWQTDPTIAPQEVVPNWPQGQFIQQIAPAQPQTTLDAYPPQQYPNGLYQTTYQQPTFETNTFYTGAVQVLSTRPPSVPSQQLTPRTNGSYTPSPSPVTQNQPQQQQQQSQQQAQQQQQQAVQASQTQNNGQRTNINAYEYMQTYVPPATPPVDNQQQPISRPNSVNGNAPTPNQQTYNQSNNAFTSVSSTSFSPSSNTAPHYVNANSGNEQPGYPQVNSNPPLISHNSSGYPGQFGGNNNQNNQDLQQQQQQQQVQIQQQWASNENAHMMWQQTPAQQPAQHAVNQQQTQDQMNESAKQSDNNTTNQYENENNHHDPGDQFNQAHRVNLNSRIKTMILNKQQDKKMEDVQKDEHNKQTGHFLWYSHHRRLDDIESDGGGFPSIIRQNPRFQQFNHDKFYNTNFNHNQFNYLQSNLFPNQFKSETEVTYDANCQTNGLKQELNFNVDNVQTVTNPNGTTSGALQVLNSTVKTEDGVSNGQEENKVKTNLGNEIPQCNCFPSGNLPPEPGTYYTHLGCSSNLANLRKDLELRTGVTGKAIRIEKIKYTGKEGKSAQGCPIAKWIIRRSDYQEKYLIIVKHRQGHVCFSAFIVVCIVAWEGIRQKQADDLYSILTDKLNKFGIPTTRRCGTNEQRNCACQGLHPDTSGASFSFGCSWSMYYNGCKFARSKCVRKFRLSSQNEEMFMEEKLQAMATYLVPLYKSLAPIAYKNQCENEITDMECRLGDKSGGRPFSGVTACLDFCSHSHKDTHNMNDGCTVVVTLTKERVLGKPKQDEQLHVLPLYTVDTTDEFGASQKNNRSIEVLKSYKCEVRMRTVPLQSCRRSKKKKSDPNTSLSSDETVSPKKRSSSKETPSKGCSKNKSTNPELQNNQITSTVNNNKQVATSPSASLDRSHSIGLGQLDRYHRHETPVLDNWNNPRTAFNVTYPVMTPYSYTPTQYNLPSMQNATTANMQYAANGMMPSLHHHYAVNQKVQDSNSGSTSTSNHQLVIDYDQHRMPMQPFRTPYYHPPRHLNDYNCSYPVGFNPSPYDYQRSVLPSLPSLNWSHTTPSFPSVSHHGMLPSLSSFQMHTTSQLQLPGLGAPPALMPPPTIGGDLDARVVKPSIGTVKEISENLESFKDSTIGGLAIALSHGSVLFECAKYEFHATTALKCPNRLSPTRISLVFYQHRNLNKPKHGWDAYEEKMRLRKMGVSVSPVAVSNSVDVSTTLDTAPSMPSTESYNTNANAGALMHHPLSTMTSFHTYVPLQPMQMPNYYQSTFGI